MQRADFAEDRRHHVVRAPEGYWAFVPPPLPPVELALTPGLVTELSAADRALGLLAGVGMRLPNPYLLLTPFLRREAVLSSKIEGTQARLTEVVLYEAAPTTNDEGDVREVVNYVHALELGIERQPVASVGLGLIRELHRVLMTGVRGQEGTPGEFRAEQNWIGPARVSLEDAIHVPPPVAQMHDALGALEAHLRAPSDLPPLVRLALIHYQFEAIHPFLDGNGRIGRLLVSLLLQEWELLPQPLLYLSAYLERHKREYYDHLLAVSRHGEWEPWVRFFLAGVAQQARDAVERADQLLGLRDVYQKRLQAARASSLPLRLVDDLFIRPAMSVNDAAETLGVTRRAAQLNIDKLVEAGVLDEATGRQRNRVYLAREIVRLLEQDLPVRQQAA